MSLGGLCKQNEANLQRETGRKRASYFLNYSFREIKPSDSYSACITISEKTLLHIQELWGCTASYIPIDLAIENNLEI